MRKQAGHEGEPRAARVWSMQDFGAGRRMRVCLSPVMSHDSRRQPGQVALATSLQQLEVPVRVEQRHHVAPRTERARARVDTVLARKLRDQIRRKQFDELAQHRRLQTARLFVLVFSHPASWQDNFQQPSHLFPPHPMGRLWSKTCPTHRSSNPRGCDRCQRHAVATIESSVSNCTIQPSSRFAFEGSA